MWIRVITKLPNSEQSYKRKVKTHKYYYVKICDVYLYYIFKSYTRIWHIYKSSPF